MLFEVSSYLDSTVAIICVPPAKKKILLTDRAPCHARRQEQSAERPLLATERGGSKDPHQDPITDPPVIHPACQG